LLHAIRFILDFNSNSIAARLCRLLQGQTDAPTKYGTMPHRE